MPIPKDPQQRGICRCRGGFHAHDEKGEFVISIKKNGFIYDVVYASHPFDAIGWDGYLYPYAFSIHDFEPITGRVHQPPPVHQTFSGRNFVICSFVCPIYVAQGGTRLCF